MLRSNQNVLLYVNILKILFLFCAFLKPVIISVANKKQYLKVFYLQAMTIGNDGG